MEERLPDPGNDKERARFAFPRPPQRGRILKINSPNEIQNPQVHECTSNKN